MENKTFSVPDKCCFSFGCFGALKIKFAHRSHGKNKRTRHRKNYLTPGNLY